MTTTLRLGLFAIALTCLSAGCKHSPSQYIAPRVTGRVLDAQTQQPIAGVRVQRLADNPPRSPSDAARGAEALALAPGGRTQTDGTFALTSQRDLAFFRKLRWYSITLSFDHAGYLELTKTYAVTDVVQPSSGEPWINAGDILLFPKPGRPASSDP